MIARLLSMALVVPFLGGCVSTTPVAPVHLAPQEEVVLRRLIAQRIDSSPIAYSLIAPPAFSQATIAGPYEIKELNGAVTAYCVKATLDAVLIPTPIGAQIILKQQDGKQTVSAQVTRRYLGCNNDNPKPFPELIEARERRRQKNAEEPPMPRTRP